MSNSKYTPHRFHFKSPYQQIDPNTFIVFVMITARKILRNTLSLHPLLRYLCSNQPNGQPANQEVKLLKLSPEAQRALWANHFINTIINQPMTTSIESLSLRDKLINSPNPTTFHNFDQDIKKEMTSIFTTGASIDRTVFDQDRIRDAKLKNQDRGLVFYPSVFVTSKIFNQLHALQSRIMFQGSYGIGKTISIVFYIYLSNIINKYAFFAAKKENEEMLRQYESLVRKKHLPPYIYKFWYWSINWNTVRSNGFSLQKIFAEQATELTQEEREGICQCKTIEEAQQKIRQLYKKANFTHIAVLDQINHAVSFIRKWNSFVLENQVVIKDANSNKYIKKTDEESIYKVYHPTTQLISLAKQFTAINPFDYVLNSSINIERQQLLDTSEINNGQLKGQQKRLYQPLTFQLKSQNNQHNSMRIAKFPFQKQIQSQSGRIRFWQFFWELLEEKAKDQKLNEQNLKNIKLTFLKQACSKPLKSYYQFLHIRQFLSDYKNQNSKFFKGQKFDEAIKKIIQNFEQNCFKQLQDNILTFMKKGDSNFKKTLLRAINIYAGQHLERKAERLVLDLQLIGHMVGRKGLKQYLLSSEHNNQLIPVQDIPYKSHMIEIQWSPQDFIDISQNIIYPQSFNSGVLLPKHPAVDKITNPSNRGTTVERLVNLFLKPGVLFTLFNVEKERQLKHKGQYWNNRLNLQFSHEQIFISDQNNFIAFDLNSAQSKSKSFQEHFQSLLNDCANQSGLWIVAFPAKNSPKQKDNIKNPSFNSTVNADQQISPESKLIQSLIKENAYKKDKIVLNKPSIDFALAKCTINKDNQKQFIIYTFDTTIAFTSVSQKEHNSVVLLLQKAAGFKKKIKIRHHIFCNPKHCRDSLPVNEHIKICYSDIIKMQIQQTPDMSTSKKNFDQVKKLIARLYERLYIEQ